MKITEPCDVVRMRRRAKVAGVEPAAGRRARVPRAEASPTLRLLAAGILALLLGLPACTGPEGAWGSGHSTRLVATWNVQNLFDATQDGTEYPEFDPRRGWNQARFELRAGRLAKALEGLAPGGPELLALQEVENARVVEDLCTRWFPPGAYPYRVTGRQPGSPVQTALLSRHPFGPVTEWSLGEGRSVLEAWFGTEPQRLVVFVVHWKSRRDGAEAQAQRLEESRWLQSRLEDLLSQGQEHWLILGDFNDSLEQAAGDAQPALYDPGRGEPDPGSLRLQPWTEFAGAAGGPSARESPEGEAQAASPRALSVDWWHPEAGPGSYWFREAWERLDRLAPSAALAAGGVWSLEPLELRRGPPFTDESGRPAAWSARQPEGLSDHLPVLARLTGPW